MQKFNVFATKYLRLRLFICLTANSIQKGSMKLK